MTMTASRRSFLAAFAGLPLLTAGVLRRDDRPGVAITIDDFDLSDATLLDGKTRDRRIRDSLRRHRLKAAGFVTGKHVADRRGAHVLRGWSDDGHLLGNHSYSHDRFSGDDPKGFMADILRCEAILEGRRGFVKLFRFPYLAEGRTAAGRDRMRVLLGQHGYRNGHVTIDTSDWFIDGRLRAKLRSDPGADIAPYRRFYLDHIWDRATYYDRLAQRVFGHSIQHTLLLHHRLTTALFLDDLLQLFGTRGWRLVDAADAFASPVFALEPNNLPTGQSLVWAAAKASGKFERELRFPGEDGTYEEPRMNALGL